MCGGMGVNHIVEDKTLTLYPSIEKPWIKYYSDEAINAPLPQCTIYQYIWENNKDYLRDTAINYYGTHMAKLGKYAFPRQVSCKDTTRMSRQQVSALSWMKPGGDGSIREIWELSMRTASYFLKGELNAFT